METRKPRLYREIIDALVEVCRDGQGQIGPQRVRAGIWNRNATPDFIPEQHAINELLSRMTPVDREVVAEMLSHQVEVGIFESLKVLERFGVAPFQDGYEGSPFHDFAGRMGDWKWPESASGNESLSLAALPRVNDRSARGCGAGQTVRLDAE